MGPTCATVSLLTSIQAPETQSTVIGVKPSELLVRIFSLVMGLSGKNLVRIDLLPKSAVSTVGNDLADPWTVLSVSKILGPVIPTSPWVFIYSRMGSKKPGATMVSGFRIKM